MVGDKKRGRPKTKFIARGHHALKKKMAKLLAPARHTPEPPPILAISGTPLSGDDAQITRLALLSEWPRFDREDTDILPLWLGILKDQDEHTLIATIYTEECPCWFEKQFKKKTHGYTSSCFVKSFGHPGDSPHDLRGRPFVVRWVDEMKPHVPVYEQAVRENRPLCCWTYVCAGMHDRVVDDEAPPEEGDDEDKEDADEESEASGEADEEEQEVLQVMAGDLSCFQIWQKNSHEDASKDHKFNFSRRIRLSIMQALRCYDIVAMISKPRGQSAETFPPHRIPTTTQVKGMMSAQRNRTWLHFNPFRATPHDFNKDDSKSSLWQLRTISLSTAPLQILQGRTVASSWIQLTDFRTKIVQQLWFCVLQIRTYT
ncbi:hypothetical protein C8J57DRAFT_1239541 [Mycena rebaudengoi]|nr:hypothetical protein C8J57DRAFT_1239541 [Mycena rebaudengoi]